LTPTLCFPHRKSKRVVKACAAILKILSASLTEKEKGQPKGQSGASRTCTRTTKKNTVKSLHGSDTDMHVRIDEHAKHLVNKPPVTN